MDGLVVMAEHGILLQSAKGPVPNLADLVAGDKIKGSWWGHPRGHEIYAVINTVRESPDVVALRLIKRKITLVHRRLWPALVRVAPRLEPEALAALHEEHLSTGRHRTTTTPFPEWVPRDAITAAKQLTDEQADAALGVALP